MELYSAAADRYKKMPTRRCGKSGVILPQVSLGLWHNFGSSDSFDNARKMLRCAFDSGIFHFDLANNYGPEPGAAEENFGRIFKADLHAHRDELLISSKAGYLMWEGPYGEWGSRKSLIASCDQSLKRMQLDYVDIFYHHRPDPETPLEESMLALDHIVRIPPYSHRVPRVRWYSGYCYVSSSFAYRTITFYGRFSQIFLLD